MKLPATLKKMNKRERYAIMAATGVIGIFLIASFIVGPFFSKMEASVEHLLQRVRPKVMKVEAERPPPLGFWLKGRE